MTVASSGWTIAIPVSFYDYKEMANTGSLFRLDSALLNILNPELLRSFDEVFMLTYLFDGQYQKAYLDFFGFDYNIIGVEQDESGYRFSDRPDAPHPLDYRELIRIVDDPKLNAVGDKHYALSKAWYDRRGYDNPEIRKASKWLKEVLSKYSRWQQQRRGFGLASRVMSISWIVSRTGRFRNNFLQTSARATNQYKSRTDIAYMVNRFADPNIMKFFAKQNVTINPEHFALSEMLQWIWRSAIRDDKPINLYIPSRHMRELLINWINTTNPRRMPN